MKKPMYIILGVLIVAGVLFVWFREGNISLNLDNSTSDQANDPEAVVWDDDTYGVSSNHPIAVEVGKNILENGGNAADAAVAMSYALGVVEPFGSGLGGGGEMVFYFDDGSQDPVTYQYKERVPLSGNIPANDMGVPGFVKGMDLINQELGTKPIEELMDPAIAFAEEGFEADGLLVSRLNAASDRLPVNELEQFFPNGEVISENDTVQQPELAETLKAIQAEGPDAFYDGEIAKSIIAHSGHVTTDDMKAYKPVEAEPVVGEFMGYDIYTASPPLSGVTLVQILQTADVLQEYMSVENETDYIHLLAEITKRAYDDRLNILGDPEFFDNPIAETTSMEYAEDLADSIDLENISTGFEEDDSMAEDDADNTTHFVVIDQDGMVVSTTNTLGDFFGSGQYVEGFFLNDAMNNFSEREASPNSVEPGKTPRSFMSPTILVSDEKIIGIGTPGGSRIPMMMGQTIIQNIMFGKEIQEAIDAPRFALEGDDLFIEDMKDGISDEVRDGLTERGYNVYLKDTGLYFGGIQALVLDKENNELYGGADSRRIGTWDTGN